MRVVIADDHPVVREGLSALLDSVPSITVAGFAGPGREAVHRRSGSAPTCGIARRVLGLVSAPPTAGLPFPDLTGREREALDLIASGGRNAEIARRMSIAPETVANHVSAIFAKLRVADRGAAIIAARDAGLGRGPS
jgi:DNA-binding NarL/FixJ family response regulator